MKSKIQTLKLMFMFVLMSLSFKTYSQDIASTSCLETTLGVPAAPFSTESDVYYDAFNTPYRVTVYSDLGANAAPYLLWDVNGSQDTVRLAATNQIWNADVGLVNDGGVVNAIVTWYYSGSPNAVYIQNYYWSGSSFVLGNSNFWNVTVQSSLHIDTDPGTGNFVVIYDDPNLDIYTINGNFSGGTFTYQNSGNPYQLTLPAPGSMPDVSIYNSGTDYHITYVTNGGNLYELDYIFSTGAYITSSGWANSPPFIGYTFDYPRISSAINGNPYDHTVVVTATNHMGSYIIYGINGNTPWILMDYNGSNPSYCFYGTSSVPNTHPMVTYDSNGDVWVGWVMDNRSNGVGGNAVVAKYPVVYKCDNVGYPLLAPYLEVPYTSYLGYMDDYDFFSMAGRYANDEIYMAFYDGGNNYVYTKNATPGISSMYNFRKGPAKTTIFNNELSNIPVNTNVTLTLLDLSGKIVLSEKGTAGEIRNELLKTSATMSSSVYLARIFSDDGKYNVSDKIYLKNK